ncbi:MAG: sel1 repeat family protein [Nitrospira sp.]|nr:sel1 repeat family protein [Nitrospira sp.]
MVRDLLMALRIVTGVVVGVLILFGQIGDASVARAQISADVVPLQSEKDLGLAAQPLAEAGDANAQWMAGQGLLSHPDADPAAALKWFLRAADQGHGLAQRDLGLLYEAGWGVEQSVEEAYFWYSLAALHDSGRASLRRDALATGLSREQRDSVERRLRSWQPRKESPIAK